MNGWLTTLFILMAVMASGISKGEDLTTLDGHAYTNITEVTKYPKMIVITCSGNRKGIQNTNLPPEFAAKYGIVLKTNAPEVVPPPEPAGPPLAPLDAFLWTNRDSGLAQMIEVTNIAYQEPGFSTDFRWSLCVTSGIVILSTVKCYFLPDAKVLQPLTNSMHIKVGQEDFIAGVFNKYLEWNAIATTNHAETFEKEIARHPLLKSEIQPWQEGMDNVEIYTFSWQNGAAYLEYIEKFERTDGGSLIADDVSHFQKLLVSLPDLKEKLAAAIRHKQSQNGLFK